MTAYPDVMERDNGSMTAREIQLLHLVMLAIELDVLGRCSSLNLSSHDVPVLYVPRVGEHLKIKAEPRDNAWFYTWGRGGRRVEVNGQAARRIAAMVSAS